jgi:2'-5' RNA ligase
MCAMSQFSLFGAETPPTDGLFLAILPEAHARARIEGQAQLLRSQHGLKSRMLAADRYHISLFSFGEYHGLPRNLVPEVMKAAAAVEVPPFDAVLDRAMSFSGGKKRPLVLCGGDNVAMLIAFHRVASTGMQRFRLGRSKPQFMPHVTLLYDEQMIEEQPIERIGWTVTEFVLIHSLLGRGQYNILGRWPLRADGVRLH